MKLTTVYTDGACIGNPGPGGWAWAVPGGAHASGAEPASTNQRMELCAVFEALKAHPGPLQIVSDSKYVVNCFTQRWYEKWERNDWRGSNRQPVANQDLWRPLIAAWHLRSDQVSFEWVKGHSGDPMNDVVDRLATEAARLQTGRSGAQPPVELGAPDEPRPGGAGAGTIASDLASVPGWRVAALGPRPPALGGYSPDNPTAVLIRRRLTEALSGLRSVHPDVLVLTGLGLGAEQLAAEAAELASVPYLAVLAYPDAQRVWPQPTQERYRHLLAGAADVRTLSNQPPGSRQAAGVAARKRDHALLGAAHGALVVWDGSDRYLGEHVALLEQRIPDDVWIISPS